ncbi:MAG TPA: hypothetical protein VHI52_14270 [Verrucomicrobiae bacterium]|nr:hypothetical protein [Verrucomicrobiae bacterium]
MNRIAVALFNQLSQAEPLRQRLIKAGIAAELHEDLLLQKLWFVSKRAAGVWLEVPALQFEEAEELLSKWEGSEELRDAVRCPECRSLLVEYPQFARHSVLTNMAAGIAAEFGLVEKDYYCERCHYTWPKEPGSPKRERAHMAPYYFIEGVRSSILAPAAQSGPDKASLRRAA